MSVKNNELGGTDWSAENWYYQDVNDTFDAAGITAISGVRLAGLTHFPLNTINGGMTTGYRIASNAWSGLTNMTVTEGILHNNSTGSISATSPRFKLPTSISRFAIYVDGVKGRMFTSTPTGISDYSSFVLGFNNTTNETTFSYGITDGSGTVTMFSEGTTFTGVRRQYKGNLRCTFSHDNSSLMVDRGYMVGSITDTISSSEDRFVTDTQIIDISSLSGTLDLTSLGSYTYGISGFNPLDVCTVRISTDGGSSYTSIGENGVFVTTAAAGTDFMINVSGFISSISSGTIIKSVLVIPILG